MTLVSLTSELLWQRNDAITFFTCLCISRHREIRNRLKELVPPLVASIMAQFEQIQRKRFRNILKQSFKGHKNREKHSINIIGQHLKRMMRSGNVV